MQKKDKVLLERFKNNLCNGLIPKNEWTRFKHWFDSRNNFILAIKDLPQEDLLFLLLFRDWQQTKYSADKDLYKSRHKEEKKVTKFIESQIGHFFPKLKNKSTERPNLLDEKSAAWAAKELENAKRRSAQAIKISPLGGNATKENSESKLRKIRGEAKLFLEEVPGYLGASNKEIARKLYAKDTLDYTWESYLKCVSPILTAIKKSKKE